MLLEFIYTGKLTLDSNCVWKVLTAASQLQLSTAAELCRKYIDTHLSIDAVADAVSTNVRSILFHFSFWTLCPTKPRCLQTSTNKKSTVELHHKEGIVF